MSETKQAKHTPGPWKYTPQIDGRSRGWIRAGEVMYDGALHPPSVARVCDRGWGSGEAEANARLIAAAPELLQAAKDLLEWLREFYPNEPLFESEPNHANVTIVALEAAIQKAEGRHE